MTAIDMHFMGDVVHLHVTGPTTSSPVSTVDLLRTIQALVREGRVLVRADNPNLMALFEHLIYTPGTPANEDFMYYLTTIPIPGTRDIGYSAIAVVRKTPRLRKFLSAMNDDRYRRLYEINIVEGWKIGHWAWEQSVEEAATDVARDLKDLWNLRKYKVTARM